MADRPVLLEEIEITPQMIEAGVDAMRQFHFGQSESQIVEAIYLAMALEFQAAAFTSSTSLD